MLSGLRQNPGQRMAAVLRTKYPNQDGRDGDEKGDKHREVKQLAMVSTLGHKWKGNRGKERVQDSSPVSSLCFGVG